MTLAASCEVTGLNPMSFTDQHGTIVLERMRYQREHGRFCDVSIVVKERRFAAHRNVLAACSPYFDTILKSSKVVKEQVIVNCANPSAFELLLNYMYSGSVVIDRATVSELLRLANNFLLTKLKNYCAEYLDRYLDAANCLSVRQLAGRYNIPALLKAASEYFDVNINRCLLESIDILKYSLQQLTSIIEDPKYQDVISPDVHLKLIARWINDDIPSRVGHFRQLLQSCPIGEVADVTFNFLLDYSTLFINNQPSRFLLLRAMNESGHSMEKYASQLSTLTQQFAGTSLMEPLNTYEENEYESNEDVIIEDNQNEMEDAAPVEGHPSSSKILETLYDDNGQMIPRLKIKISLGRNNGTALPLPLENPKPIRKARGEDKQNLFRKAISNNLLRKRAPRPGPQPKRNEENDSLPMTDDDDIDGVYATSSLDNVVLYTEEDAFHPDEVEEGEDMHVEGGVYPCNFCSFATNQDVELQRHRVRQHNRNTVYCCQMCDYENIWSKPFYDHCKQHYPHKPYQCDQCTYTCDGSMQTFLSHRLTHTQDRFFKCMECHYGCRSRTQLWAHERMHSSLDDRPLHCEECGRGFTQQGQAALDQHVATHDDPRLIVCDECGFSTKSQDHLVLHRKQHTGDMLHCHIGQEMPEEQLALAPPSLTPAMSKSNPMSHARVSLTSASTNYAQTPTRADIKKAIRNLKKGLTCEYENDENGYFCEFVGCDYSSPKKSQLAAHLRTHMAVRAHMCKTCGRGFIEKSHLVRHERIHLEDKPFKCNACDYASSRRDKLKEHILKHHNGQQPNKAHRRRYRRERQLAQLKQQANAPSINDSLFRPITASESISQWQAQSQSFQQPYSPLRDNTNGVSNVSNGSSNLAGPSGLSHIAHSSNHHGSHQSNNQITTGGGGGGFSPPRASSVINPNVRQMTQSLSPTSMSLMNIRLAGPDTPLLDKDLVLGGGMDRTPTLLTPVPRSPHNRSDPFGINTPTDMHRPMSLPPYGQLQGPSTSQQQQQQQSSSSTIQQQQQQHDLWNPGAPSTSYWR